MAGTSRGRQISEMSEKELRSRVKKDRDWRRQYQKDYREKNPDKVKQYQQTQSDKRTAMREAVAKLDRKVDRQRKEKNKRDRESRAKRKKGGKGT